MLAESVEFEVIFRDYWGQKVDEVLLELLVAGCHVDTLAMRYMSAYVSSFLTER